MEEVKGIQGAGTQTPMRLLIVDDDRHTAQTVRKALCQWPARIRALTNVADAIRLLFAEDFDVLLLGSHLPGMPGEMVLPLLREVAPCLTVILLAGDASPDGQRRLTLAGAFRVLPKPLEGRELMETLNQAVAYQQQRAGKCG